MSCVGGRFFKLFTSVRMQRIRIVEPRGERSNEFDGDLEPLIQFQYEKLNR